MPLAAHCPHCGGKVIAEGPSLGRCCQCSREVYANSRPTAGVFLVRGEQVLLVRRGAEPALGTWDIPGGFLEEGETPEDGARREILEELGWNLQTLKFSLINVNPWPAGAVLDIFFEAPAPPQAPSLGSDAADFGWFDMDDLPKDLAFEASRIALEKWRAQRHSADYRLPDGTSLHPVSSGHLKPVESMSLDQLSAASPAGWRPRGGAWTLRNEDLLASAEGSSEASLWCPQPISGNHLLMFDLHTMSSSPAGVQAYWEGSMPEDGSPALPHLTKARWFGPSLQHCTLERTSTSVAYSLNTEPMTPGRTYQLAVGRWGSTDFVFMDGRLAFHIQDPLAIRRPESHVALGLRSGRVAFSSIRLFQLTP